MATFPDAGGDPAAARTGSRRAYWPGGYHDTPVYDYDKLAAGNVVAGPAIIDSDSTTYVLPANATLAVDRYRNGVIALGGDGARTAAERGTL
jgi:N-methylhydantoinase A/oxoprolinase/acetone carboxylase beta subunit